MKAKKSQLEKNVEKLIKVMNVEETYRGVLVYVINKSFSNAHSVADKVIKILLTPSNLDLISDLTKKSYMEHYSPKEISCMLKFYGSKTGQTIITKSVALTTKLSESMRKLTDSMLQSSKDEIMDIVDQQIKQDNKTLNEPIDNNIINEEVDSVIVTRYNFANKYIKDKGWDSNQLTNDQILEIRSQDGWIKAGKE